jgi:pyruvate kinase
VQIAGKTSPSLADELSLQQALESLEEKMNSAVETQLYTIDKLPPSQKISAYNLIHYLALRREDVSSLQNTLHISGLSSLTNSESHILHQLQSVLERLGKRIAPEDLSDCDSYKGRELIQQRSIQLFGLKKDKSIPSIMVTFDTKFINNFPLVKKLLEAGMNVARINCAHDDKEIWENMIALVRGASTITGIPCKIFMDLAGSKIRTRILGKGRSKEKASLAVEQEIILAEQDSHYDASQVVIGCSEPGIIWQLKPGERVLFDDGVIETKVISNINGIATLKVIRISKKKPTLKSKKGINFPDTELTLPALTRHDRKLIPFICQHADLFRF